ncbi:hypothetical protein GOODEAATRI_001211 [Goodea atripinnis]|uniref:Uncharacterized protein n=1 Tax=Goodea atripinnis TaxID=208336 RepID=A0ABV0P223_9TELE
MINNRMVYFNMLHYDPPKPTGPIRRTVPFSVPVACYFNRFIPHKNNAVRFSVDAFVFKGVAGQASWVGTRILEL